MTGRNSDSHSRRLKAYRKGHVSEFLAAIALMFEGYRIVQRRFKTKQGEIDLIARRGDLIVLVEVKARASQDAAVNAVTSTAARRIEAAGDIWLARQKDASRLSIRRDIVAVMPWRWPRHFPDAF